MTQKNITIKGKPLAKARPRFSRQGGQVRTFNSQAKQEKVARLKLRLAYGCNDPLVGPVDLNVLFVFEKPKTRKNNELHVGPVDLDNLLKFLCDVGNGILWQDDRQVARINATKIYGEESKTIITISEIDVD